MISDETKDLSALNNLPAEPQPRKGRARRIWALAGFGTAAVIGAGVFAGAVGAGYLYTSNETVRNVIRAVVSREITPDKAFPGKDSLTLVVIGADQDRDDRKQVVGKAQRSDTLMSVRFDFAGNRASIVSIPRDTKIRIPGYRGYQKINAAFAYGGADLAKEVVDGVLGVSTDHPVVVNFEGFKKIVDLVGGVPVTVDKPLHYDDNWGDLHVHLEPGNHWLNGEQALGYCRIRKVDSDLHRAERQQQFLQALKGRLADPRVWMKASALIDAARGSIETELTDSQLLCLATFLKNLPAEGVQTATLPGDEGRSFVTLYPDKVREIARNLLGVENAPLNGLSGGGNERLASRERRRGRWRNRSEASEAEREAWNEERSTRRERSRRKSRTAERKEEEAASEETETASVESIPAEESAPAVSHSRRDETDTPVKVRETPSESSHNETPSHPSPPAVESSGEGASEPATDPPA